jgi:hypothetical protein
LDVLSASDRLDEILKSVQAPTKLSPPEKQNVKKSIAMIKDVIDEMGEKILEMDRDEAYLSIRSLIDSIKSVDRVKEETRVQPPDPGQPIRPQTPKVKVAAKKKTVPEMEALISALPQDLQAKAAKLECIEQMRQPEIGIDAICPECDGVKLLSCIKTFDTSIRVESGAPSKQE